MHKVLELKAVVANRCRAMAVKTDELNHKENIAANAQAVTVAAVAVRNANAKRTVAVMESLPEILKMKHGCDELVPVAARMLMEELADVTKKTEDSVEAVRSAVKASEEASAELPKLRSEANSCIKALNDVLQARAKCLQILSPVATGSDVGRSLALHPFLDTTCVEQNVSVSDEACVAASVEMLYRMRRDMSVSEHVSDEAVVHAQRQLAADAFELMQQLAAARERVAAFTKEADEVNRAYDAQSKDLASVTERLSFALSEAACSSSLETEARETMDRFSGKFRLALVDADVATAGAVVSADKFVADLPMFMEVIGFAKGDEAVANAVSPIMADIARFVDEVKKAQDAVVLVEDFAGVRLCA